MLFPCSLSILTPILRREIVTLLCDWTLQGTCHYTERDNGLLVNAGSIHKSLPVLDQSKLVLSLQTQI